MIVVTGGNGQLGRAIVQALMEQGITGIAVSVREPEKAEDLHAFGVQVRAGDYDNPAGLVSAFQGADALLLVSTMAAVEQRRIQHRQAVAAAVKAGVGRIVYTSFLQTDPQSRFPYAGVHAETESWIAASGIPATILRPSIYGESALTFAQQAVAGGELALPAGDGRVAFITRRDIARVAAAVLAGTGHDGKTYTLTSPAAHSYADIAEGLSQAWNRKVVYRPIQPSDYRLTLETAGFGSEMATAYTGLFEEIADGAFRHVTTDVETLTGTPAEDVLSVVRRGAPALIN